MCAGGWSVWEDTYEYGNVTIQGLHHTIMGHSCQGGFGRSIEKYWSSLFHLYWSLKVKMELVVLFLLTGMQRETWRYNYYSWRERSDCPVYTYWILNFPSSSYFFMHVNFFCLSVPITVCDSKKIKWENVIVFMTGGRRLKTIKSLPQKRPCTVMYLNRSFFG